MRLTCPNCNAQYEVDAAVIPDLGRDVQCSNCGQTWFQPGPLTPAPQPSPEPAPSLQAAAATASPAPQDTAFEGWDDDAPEPEFEAELEAEWSGQEPQESEPAQAEPAPAEPAEPAHQERPDAAQPDAGFLPPDGYDSEFDEDYEPAPPAPIAPARRAMDDDLLAVLREEAEREVQARKAEGSALETQPELGLAVAKPEPRPVEREARLSGFDEMPAEAAPRSARRDLLPDIEEINSTLRATSDRSQAFDRGDPALDRPRGSGFGIGFGGALAVAAIGLGLYIGAPNLSAAVPAAAPTVARYVAGVDAARLWLDGRMSAITEAMRPKSDG